MSATFATLRIDGPHLAADVQTRIVEAIGHARGLGKLLIVTSGVTGYAPPTLSARSQMIRAWAEAGQGLVTLALVARPEFVDPQRFGVVTAGNFGMRANVFVDETAAVEWLVAQR